MPVLSVIMSETEPPSRFGGQCAVPEMTGGSETGVRQRNGHMAWLNPVFLDNDR